MTTNRTWEALAFRDSLEQTLNHFPNPQWLGEHSPLASPYFLGARLTAQVSNLETASAELRGKLLQQLLDEACSQISGRYAERYQIILREYYFKDNPFEVVSRAVGLARNSFHLSRNAAIVGLEQVLISKISPTVRLEAPPAIPTLLERTSLATQSLAALRNNQTVSVIGGGGMGKTVFASYLATQLERPVFWVTFRPGLNDHLGALLFALGYALHQLGSSLLWLELVASPNQLRLERLLNIVRYTIAQLTVVPLICIDEVDRLQPSQETEHGRLLEFIQSLRGHAPLLLVGQRPLVDSDHFCTLGGLSVTATQELLERHQISLGQDDLTAIHAVSQGNPRLIEIVIALYKSGESMPDLLDELSQQPALEFLLERMLQRLTATERTLLLELSVYRQAAPAAAWNRSSLASARQRLSALHLIQHDGGGGIALLPAYQTALYNLLPPEKRTQLHLAAANVRATFGEVMSTVYHLVKGLEVEKGIWYWYEHRQTAISHGQARNALELLNSIAIEPLSAQTQETLLLLRAELQNLTGNPARSLENIRSIVWKTPILAIEADHLAGVIANDQGDERSAEQWFQQAITTAEKLISVRTAHIHKGLAWRHLSEREIEKATYEVARARYEIDQFEGDLHYDLNKYEQAAHHYLLAMRTAEGIGYTEGIAKTANSLAVVYLTQGRLEELRVLLARAEQLYNKLGMIIQAISLNLNRATMHNMAGEHDQALQAAQQVVEHLTRVGADHPIQIAIANQIIAEAYLGLGNLAAAAESARSVIEAEELTLLPEAYRTYGETLGRQGHYDDALRFINAAIDLATRSEDRFLAAYGWRALGQVYLLQKQTEKAHEAFDNATELFSEIALPNEVEQTERLVRRGVHS